MSEIHDCKVELHRAGSKATPGRLAVLKLLEKEKKSLTAIQIQKRLKSLNLVSVYRILDALVAARLAHEGSDGHVAHFQYGRRPHHHHLVCADCGFIASCAVC